MRKPFGPIALPGSGETSYDGGSHLRNHPLETTQTRSHWRKSDSGHASAGTGRPRVYSASKQGAAHFSFWVDNSGYSGRAKDGQTIEKPLQYA